MLLTAVGGQWREICAPGSNAAYSTRTAANVTVYGERGIIRVILEKPAPGSLRPAVHLAIPRPTISSIAQRRNDYFDLSRGARTHIDDQSVRRLGDVTKGRARDADGE